MKNLIPVLILTFCLYSACSRAIDSNERSVGEAISNKPIAKTDIHNSKNALDWQDIYKGTLPCADCEGIETKLTLNSDLSYVLETYYFGKNDALEEEKKGTYAWNEECSIITLINFTTGPNQYKVGENQIWSLDKDGKMITGELADHYILKKTR